MSHNGDLDFAITSVLDSAKNRSMRYAVLSPLFPQWPEKGVDVAFEDIYGRWRRKIDQLHAVGLSLVKSDSNYRRLRNCPPFGVSLEAVSAACDRPLFCPFCWARKYALKAFVYLEEKLFAVSGSRTLAVPGDTVIAAMQTSWIHETVKFNRWSHRRAAVGLALAFQEVAKPIARSRDYNRVKKPFGGVIIHAVSPCSAGILFRRSTLVLAGKTAIEESNNKRPRSPAIFDRRDYPPTRKGLAAAVGRACAYPAGLLDAGLPPIATADLITIGQRHRMLSRR